MAVIVDGGDTFCVTGVRQGAGGEHAFAPIRKMRPHFCSLAVGRYNLVKEDYISAIQKLASCALSSMLRGLSDFSELIGSMVSEFKVATGVQGRRGV
jgi:hypothetical protein